MVPELTEGAVGDASEGSAGVTPILELRGVSKHFGGVTALDSVDLKVNPSEILAIVGDNGAGKSTLIKAISGMQPPDSGSFFFNGSPVEIRTPHDASDVGIETVYQDLALCDNLDTVQNLFLGNEITTSIATGRRLNHALMEKIAAESLKDLGVTTIRSLRTPAGRLAWDRLKLHIPLVGPVLLKAALSRFASIFSILQASGVGILDSLQILSGTIGNTAISRELEGVQVNLEQGHGVARPLMAAKYFTPMLINMVAVGEEAGNLDEMLKEVSLHYDSEVEYATRRLTTAMGPVLIVAMAVLVGFFALAVYMPMWDLAKLATRT